MAIGRAGSPVFLAAPGRPVFPFSFPQRGMERPLSWASHLAPSSRVLKTTPFAEQCALKINALERAGISYFLRASRAATGSVTLLAAGGRHSLWSARAGVVQW